MSGVLLSFSLNLLNLKNGTAGIDHSILYQHQPGDSGRPAGIAGRASHFNVLQRKNCMSTIPFSRRDYYKISVAGGNAVLVTDKGEVPIDRPAIFFNDPEIEFGWKNLSGQQDGYVCLFNDLYLNAELKKELRKLKQRFRGSIYSFLFLEPEQYEQFKKPVQADGERVCG